MKEQYNAYKYTKIVNSLGYYMRVENMEEAVDNFNIVIGLIDDYIEYLKFYKKVKDKIEKDKWTIERFEEVAAKALKENKQDEWDWDKR